MFVFRPRVGTAGQTHPSLFPRGGEVAVGGFARSVRLVRRNLRSVFGYSVLVFGVGTAFGALASVPSTLLSSQAVRPSPSLELPQAPFSVTFYRTLDPAA